MSEQQESQHQKRGEHHTHWFSMNSLPMDINFGGGGGGFLAHSVHVESTPLCCLVARLWRWSRSLFHLIVLVGYETTFHLFTKDSRKHKNPITASPKPAWRARQSCYVFLDCGYIFCVSVLRWYVFGMAKCDLGTLLCVCACAHRSFQYMAVYLLCHNQRFLKKSLSAAAGCLNLRLRKAFSERTHIYVA